MLGFLLGTHRVLRIKKHGGRGEALKAAAAAVDGHLVTIPLVLGTEINV